MRRPSGTVRPKHGGTPSRPVSAPPLPAPSRCTPAPPTVRAAMVRTALVPLLLMVATLAPAAIGAAMVLWHGRIRRRRRRSPIDPDRRTRRAPGTTLRSRIAALQTDLLGTVAALALVGTTPLVGLVSRSALEGVPVTALDLGPSVLAAMVLAAVLLVRLHGQLDELGRLGLGYRAELAVGQALETLVAEGMAVRHDMPIVYPDGGRANLDHVVVGPSGVFVVETKARSRPADAVGERDRTIRVDADGVRVPSATGRARADLGTVRQARRQAARLSALLAEQGVSGQWVQPLLVYPGWRIVGGHRSRVPVLDGRSLPDAIRSAAPGRPLDATRVRAVTAALDAIEPGLRHDEQLLLPEHV